MGSANDLKLHGQLAITWSNNNSMHCYIYVLPVSQSTKKIFALGKHITIDLAFNKHEYE